MSEEQSVSVLPQDDHNTTLVRNVHPADWTNPEPASRYNLVVIGAGTAGLVAAAGAAGLGAHVALVERHLMGGDCLNYGCVPSKGIIRAARAAASVRDSGAFGVRVPPGAAVDFPAAMERMRKLRAGISRHDSAARFRELGVDRAILDGETEGFVRVHVKKGTDRIVGATIVAADAGNMISQITQAMTLRFGLKKMANVIYPYPTQAEAVRKVGDQYNRSRLTPFVKSLFHKWLAWTR